MVATINDLPSVLAEVTFLTKEGGGRSTPTLLTPQYMPHIVIQSPDVRQSVRDSDGMNRELYLGICFLNPPDDFRPGHVAKVTVVLRSHPSVDYSDVLPGATFTIREGGRIVGYGRVLARHDATPISS